MRVERKKTFVPTLRHAVEITVVVREPTTEEKVEFAHRVSKKICDEIEPIIKFAIETMR